MSDTATYRAVWRWHFYAGLFVLPFVLILSVTGAVYLFKPQIDRWEERDYRALPATGHLSPDRQLAAVEAAVPAGRFEAYRLPEDPGDAAMVQVGLSDGSIREVFVSPSGRVLGSLDPDARISATIADIHGSLLLGTSGDRLVELVASWTIVMILTGLFLWWPRPFRAGGTLYPRLRLKGRPLLRDVHRVTGFWIAGLVLVMLASGLPWAGTWGSAFAWVRAELGLVKGPQEWKVGADQHAGHDVQGAAVTSPTGANRPHHPLNYQDHSAPNHIDPAISPPTLPLAHFVARAKAERLASPALVLPPGAPQRFGPPTGPVWTIRSDARDPRLRMTLTYDPISGRELSRSGFADQHPIDRAVKLGIAWHEGHLFGLANQLIGLATALALIGLSVLGTMMWLKRRPSGSLAAPSGVIPSKRRRVVWTLLIGLGLLLPLFGASLIALLVVDRGIRSFPSRGSLVRTRRQG